MSDEKLQKALARMGLGSRREMERWIEAGRVQLNGHLAKLGDRVEKTDQVAVDGKIIAIQSAQDIPRRVLLYNKPLDEVCTRNDPQGRPTVFDKLPPLATGSWIVIGRLDINTTGLLLFTNDGELANQLMHPSSQIDREYAVRVLGNVTEEVQRNLLAGVLLEDGLAQFTDLRFFDGEGANKWYHCVLMEGKNREVRRLWESQGIKVNRLKRVRFGPVFLPSDIKVGTWREMSPKDINKLSADVGITTKKAIRRLTPDEKSSEQRRYRKQKVRQSAKQPNSSSDEKVARHQKKHMRIVGKRNPR